MKLVLLDPFIEDGIRNGTSSLFPAGAYYLAVDIRGRIFLVVEYPLKGVIVSRHNPIYKERKVELVESFV